MGDQLAHRTVIEDVLVVRGRAMAGARASQTTLVLEDSDRAYRRSVRKLESQGKAKEVETAVHDLSEVVEVLVVRDAVLSTGAVRTVIVDYVHQVRADRFDAEDLDPVLGRAPRR